MTDPYDVLRADPEMASLVTEHGELELAPAEDTFQRLVVSILRQQVSIASADAIQERLFDRFEVTPEAIAAADPAALQEAGLSTAKADYVQNVAAAYQDRGYDRAFFTDLSNDAVHEELTSIAGVGPWTADMFLMFSLGREDVFPLGDLGIRKGMKALFGAEMTRAEMREVAERWRPVRSYASLYLWRAYEG